MGTSFFQSGKSFCLYFKKSILLHFFFLSIKVYFYTIDCYYYTESLASGKGTKPCTWLGVNFPSLFLKKDTCNHNKKKLERLSKAMIPKLNKKELLLPQHGDN